MQNNDALERALATVPAGALRTINALDGLSEFTGKAVSWLYIPMVAALVFEVVMRYAFQAPTIWSMDVAVTLYAINFMVSSPYCLQSGGHIRMDFFYSGWSVRRKATMDLIMYILFYFPVHVVFLYVGFEFFWESFTTGERSIMSPWMPLLWPMKIAIPISLVIMLTQGVSEVIKCWFRRKTGENLWSTEEVLEDETTQVAGN